MSLWSAAKPKVASSAVSVVFNEAANVLGEPAEPLSLLLVVGVVLVENFSVQ